METWNAFEKINNYIEIKFGFPKRINRSLGKGLSYNKYGYIIYNTFYVERA